MTAASSVAARVGSRRALCLTLLLASSPLGVTIRAQAPEPVTVTTTSRDNPAILSTAIGTHFQGYSFAKGSDVDASQLGLIPFSYQLLLNPRV